MLLLTIYIGSTLHSLLSLPFSGANFKNQTNKNTYANNEKIRLRFLTVYFLIIDEISLLTCWFLCQIHKILQRAKGNDLPFGGIEILFSGDFNQFPPINGAGLFINSNKLLDFVISKIQNAKKKTSQSFQDATFGKLLWMSLTHCVFLHENFRQKKDSLYANIVDRAKDRANTKEDFEILQTRLLTKADSLTEPWSSTELVVCENSERLILNNELINNYRVTNKKSLIKCKAIDYRTNYDKKSDLSVIQQYLAEMEIGSNVIYLLPDLNLVLGCKYTLT